MTASLHTLVEPAPVRGGIVFLGQNLLLPSSDGGRQRFAAVIYAARGSESGASAVALLITSTFATPMMPLLRPGHVLWSELVKPHLHRLQTTLLKHEVYGQPRTLGAVSTQIASLVRHQSPLLKEGGALLLPEAPPPPSAAQAAVPRQERLVLSSPEEEVEHHEKQPPPRILTALPPHLFFSRAA